MIDLTPAQQQALVSAEELAAACQYDAAHIHQVTRLALLLFDQLTPLHQLGREERHWLELAGLLHDIGWVDGQKGHHKASLQIILTTPILPLDQRERLIVGSIARYHRKAIPKLAHDHFAALKPPEREIVRKLASILRVADGLDQTHTTVVQDLTVNIGKNKITITCATHKRAKEEAASAAEKGALFEQVFNRPLKVVCTKI